MSNGTAQSAMNDVLIEVRGLSKSFGALEVLRDIDLEVHRGEVVVIIGPSGSLAICRRCAVGSAWSFSTSTFSPT